MSDDPALDAVAAVIRALTQPLAQQPALPALDSADVRSGLVDGGRGHFGEGIAAGTPGDGRATRAAELALRDLRRSMIQADADL